jgi:hypothetical protein
VPACWEARADIAPNGLVRRARRVVSQAILSMLCKDVLTPSALSRFCRARGAWVGINRGAPSGAALRGA